VAGGANYLDKDGTSKPIVMGSYGIGSGRLMACIAEEHNDENGLIWPVTVAPYHVHLVALVGKDSEETRQQADKLYTDLQAAGIEVLFDDRDESPGVKFNDADLIGLPVRITVSQRSLQQGSVEFKRRDRKEKFLVSLDAAISRAQQELDTLRSEIQAKVVPVPYED
jgi:prolyl-tRNA synthetase